MSGQAGEVSAPSSPTPNREAAACRSASGLSAAAAFAAASSEARRSGPALPSPRRLRSGMLEPLCRYVDFRRRLGLAASELERRLTALPQDRWRIEPYPLTGERGNTLLVLGETGVFVISATYAPGHWDDVVAVSSLARKIELLLPGYPGQVRPAICHPFSTQPARVWHRADDRGEWVGAWLVGGDSVIEWLEHFGTEHGVGLGDLERFDAALKAQLAEGGDPGACRAGRRCPAGCHPGRRGDRGDAGTSRGVSSPGAAAAGESMRSISRASSRAMSESSPKARAIALSATPSRASPRSATA